MKVKLGVSNRHVHLSMDDYKILFGDVALEKERDLVQPGQFASKQKVALKTAKNIISNVRVLGPFRPYTQVEISKTDSFTLGINPPVRSSGDLEESAEITIVGPNGEITKKCCIIPTRHIHINKEEREKYGLVSVEKVKVKINSEKKTILEDVYINESPNFVLELHLDTDDGNASLAKTGDEVEIII